MSVSCCVRIVLVAAMLVAAVWPIAGQRVLNDWKAGTAPEPVMLPAEGLFQTAFASVGENVFIGGQPTERALRELRAKGVTTIVNLRMPEEMARINFDEAALAKELGIRYVHIPMNGSAANPYGPKQLDGFAQAMSSAEGKVLLHCTIAWRASHMWAAYLIRERGIPVQTAIDQTRKINLRDDQPFNNVQPVEGLLGRTVPELARPR
jgi:uncharacterized protein (TIGR01244 family)